MKIQLSFSLLIENVLLDLKLNQWKYSMNNKFDGVIECLSEGGVVLIPTDTVYGLAAVPHITMAVNKLYELKGRPRCLNLPIMVSSIDDLDVMGVDVNDCVSKLILSSFVPGPLTIAMGFRSYPLVPWLEGREEIAVRIPNDARLLSILRETGPLLVTSANRHGMPTPENLFSILAQLNGKPDKIIDGGYLKTIPSTLVNCRCNPPAVERYGVIKMEELMGIDQDLFREFSDQI